MDNINSSIALINDSISINNSLDSLSSYYDNRNNNKLFSYNSNYINIDTKNELENESMKEFSDISSISNQSDFSYFNKNIEQDGKQNIDENRTQKNEKFNKVDSNINEICKNLNRLTKYPKNNSNIMPTIYETNEEESMNVSIDSKIYNIKKNDVENIQDNVYEYIKQHKQDVEDLKNFSNNQINNIEEHKMKIENLKNQKLKYKKEINQQKLRNVNYNKTKENILNQNYIYLTYMCNELNDRLFTNKKSNSNQSCLLELDNDIILILKNLLEFEQFRTLLYKYLPNCRDNDDSCLLMRDYNKLKIDNFDINKNNQLLNQKLSQADNEIENQKQVISMYKVELNQLKLIDQNYKDDIVKKNKKYTQELNFTIKRFEDYSKKLKDILLDNYKQDDKIKNLQKFDEIIKQIIDKKLIENNSIQISKQNQCTKDIRKSIHQNVIKMERSINSISKLEILNDEFHEYQSVLTKAYFKLPIILKPLFDKLANIEKLYTIK